MPDSKLPKLARPENDEPILDFMRRIATTEANLNAALEGQTDKEIEPSIIPLLLKEAQETLRESMIQHQRLVNRLDSIIFELTPDGMTLFVNPAVNTTAGYTQEELYGRNWWDIFAPDGLHQGSEKFVKTIQTADVTGYELILQAKDGSPIYLEVNTANQYAPDGSLLRILGFAADATRRKRAEEASDLKSRFLALISHELRTPLTSIKGFASTLIAPEASFSPEDQLEFIHIINEEADKLTAMIDELLVLTRIQAGTFKVQMTASTVQEILDAYQAKLDSLCIHHTLFLDVPEDPIPIKVDKQRIGQVLVNLVQNSCKFSPKQSEVKIRAHRNGDHVQIDISDLGPGIEPHEQEKVFQAFHQVTARPWGELGGAGLGLAICRGLVNAHGGKIWVQDQPIGTTISFTLPIAVSSD